MPKNQHYLVQILMGRAWAGPHMYLMRIAREAKARGYIPVVATSAGSPLEGRARRAGFRVVTLSPDDRGAFWNQLRDHVRFGACENVHLHSIRGLPRGFISLPAHIQMLLTEHSYRFRDVLHPLSRMALSRVDKVLAISDAIASVNARALGINPERVQILHHGVDLDRFRPEHRAAHRSEARRRFRLAPDATVVLVSSVFRRIENVFALAETLSRLKDRTPEVHLLLTGDFEKNAAAQLYRAELMEKVGHLRVRGRVHFTGYLEDIEAAYAAADVVAVPTEYEAFGLPALEGMACGLPVIGSDKGAFPEIVEHGESGICIDVRDADAWTAELTRLLDDPDHRERMARGGRERAEASFAIEDHFDQLFEVYGRARLARDGAPARAAY